MGGMYNPKKYYRGLTRRKAKERRKEIAKFGKIHWRDPRAYKGFKTDVGVKSKPSKYTEEWNRRFPGAKTLKAKAAATGVPLGVVRDSYNRGMAAWRTGHRPGASEQQWGYARVHSLLLCGRTAVTADADLVRRARATSKKARTWFNRTCRRYKWHAAH